MTLAIENLAHSDYDVFITGDFNFPQIDWETLTIMNGGTSDSTLSAQYLLNFMSTHLLSQVVTGSTRGNNTLDLVLCKNDRLVSDVTCEATEISDHDMVNVLLSFNPGLMEDAQASYLNEMSFRALDFNRPDFELIIDILNRVNWKDLRS